MRCRERESQPISDGSTAVRKLSAASQCIHRVGKLNWIRRNEMRLVPMRLLIVINKGEIDWANSQEVAQRHWTTIYFLIKFSKECLHWIVSSASKADIDGMRVTNIDKSNCNLIQNVLRWMSLCLSRCVEIFCVQPMLRWLQLCETVRRRWNAWRERSWNR